MSSKEAGLILDHAGVICDVDQRFLEMVGYERQELLGKAVWLTEAFRLAFSKGLLLADLSDEVRPRCQGLSLQRRDGREVRVALASAVIEGSIRCGICLIGDREADSSPTASGDGRYETACRAAHLGVWEWRVADDQLVWDSRMYELYGAEQRGGGNAFDAWLSGLHPEDRARACAEVRAALASGLAYESEFRVIRPDGTVRELRTHGALQKDEHGKPLRLIGVSFDVTEQKQVGAALQTAKEYAENLIETANTMVVVLDAEGRVRGFNEAAERITGYARAEIEGRSWFETLVPRERYPEVWRAFAALRTGDLPRNFENPILTKAGGERLIVWQNSPVREQGQVVGTVSFGIDATERKRTEEALAREKGLLDELMTTIPDNIYFKDRASRFVKVNDTLARRFGLRDPEQAVGKSDADFFGEEHASKAYADEQRVMSTGEPLVCVEEKEDWPDGRITWVLTSKAPTRNESGQVVGLVGVSRDITDRKELEQQLRQGQKMEAIGRLAGGVAHDFNNLLGVIIGCGEAVSKRLAGNDSLRAKLAEVLKAAHRGADLTRQLLAFSRRQVLQPKAVDLNDVVSDMEAMLRRLIGEDVVLTTLLASELGSVWADPGQIGQIIMNLAVNARDAMPAGGRLTIETANVDLDAAFVARHPPSRAGRCVMLVVSDTGRGMDEETRAHLFEPFFTTQEAGKGTGLGLSTVYGIVKQSEGYIWVDSEPRLGTSFRIYLPRIDAPAEAPAASEEAGSPPRGAGETVLLVEDEASLRDSVRDTLTDDGYTVLAAHDGAEGIRIAGEHAGPIHLMVTDVIMPGMSGREAALQVARGRPQMKVLYVSGYTDEAVSRHGDFGHGTAFLSKPFTSRTLLRKCRELLDQGFDEARAKGVGHVLQGRSQESPKRE
jgi:two-component system cell cycle sensor histidine kinase/response regulator CckA